MQNSVNVLIKIDNKRTVNQLCYLAHQKIAESSKDNKWALQVYHFFSLLSSNDKNLMKHTEACSIPQISICAEDSTSTLVQSISILTSFKGKAFLLLRTGV